MPIVIDVEGRLRWASASDQTAEILEDCQGRLAQGPCMAAFSQRAPAAIRDISHEPQWGELGRVLAGEGIAAALSAPVEVDGSAIGSLDIYSSVPWDWDDSEIAALQTYAGLAASLLTALTPITRPTARSRVLLCRVCPGAVWRGRRPPRSRARPSRQPPRRAGERGWPGRPRG
jgi:GAF domain-containing protein